MVKPEVNKDDLPRLGKLFSAYHAAVSSVCDPISVAYNPAIGTGRGIFSRIFYDCTEDENEGLKIMRQRLDDRLGKSSILNHLFIYEKILGVFSNIEYAVDRNLRPNIAIESNYLWNYLGEYGKLVERHKRDFGKDSFLNYPSCLPGHFFYVPGVNFVINSSFNPSQTNEELLAEIENGQLITNDFWRTDGETHGIKLTDLDQKDEGISGTSLRSRLALTKELLNRTGLRGI